MPNQEQLKNTEDHIEQKELKSNIEQSRTRSYYSNYIGSHILALVNFQNSKHAKDNVQHYFNEYNKKIKNRIKLQLRIDLQRLLKNIHPIIHKKDAILLTSKD